MLDSSRMSRSSASSGTTAVNHVDPGVAGGPAAIATVPHPSQAILMRAITESDRGRSHAFTHQNHSREAGPAQIGTHPGWPIPRGLKPTPGRPRSYLALPVAATRVV